MLTPFGEIPDRLAGRMSMAEQHDYLRRPTRRAVLRSALVAGAASAAPVLWSQPARAAGLPLSARYVSFGADPTRQVTVSFATPGAFRQALVRYGPDTDLGATGPVQVTTVPRASAWYGRAELADLTPGRTYRYQVVVDGVAGPGGTFTTAPAQPGPFTFTAFGDQDVNAEAALLMRRLPALRPAFHLHAGDLSYADSSGAGKPTDNLSNPRWDHWLKEITPVAASTPWMTAMGNHEMEPGYALDGYAGVLDRLAMPGNGAPGVPATYSFTYGNVGFVCLDSNDVSYEIPANLGYTGGAQQRWLGQTLASFRRVGSGVDFVVAYFHHCPYSTNQAHGSEGGVRDTWVPVFDRYGVDLVINGHNHCYERTAPLRGGRPVTVGTAAVDSSRGTTYITAGGGGAALTTGFTSPRRLGKVWEADHRSHVLAEDWSMPTGVERHSVLVADVEPGPAAGGVTTMRLRAVDSTGQVVDQVVLRRQGAVRRSAAPPDKAIDPVPWVVGGATGLAVIGGAGVYAARRYREA